jgi:uncharacterized protein (TIGR02246 family)
VATDEEQLRDLKRRYVRCLDSRDWAGLAAVFARDAEVDAAAHPRGRDGVVGHIRAVLEGMRSRHTVHSPVFRLLGPDTATGTWEMTDEVAPDPGHPPAGATGWVGAGRYEEEYVREDGAWRISRMRLVRSRRVPPAS